MKNFRNRITPCLWFDREAEDAAHFYTFLFKNSAINHIGYHGETNYKTHGKQKENVLTVDFELAGQPFTAINGGPHFKFTPAISLFVICETEVELYMLWSELAEGGQILMELDEYEWSKKYGWVADRYGLSWQVSLGKLGDVNGQKITPTFLFVSEQGRAEDAINHYTSIFEHSGITGIMRYKHGQNQPEGTVKHAQFTLDSMVFMAMDGTPVHEFNFNEAFSLVINCDNQEQVDYYWQKLSALPEAEQCGWLKDKFGVSWQVVPVVLNDMLHDEDAKKSKRVMNAMLQMKKLDIVRLQGAYNGVAKS